MKKNTRYIINIYNVNNVTHKYYVHINYYNYIQTIMIIYRKLINNMLYYIKTSRYADYAGNNYITNTINN